MRYNERWSRQARCGVARAARCDRGCARASHQYARTEIDKLPPDPANELLPDKLFDATVEVDQLAKYSSGPFVCSMLGDAMG
ncbi:MAG: hypothetical protein JWP08_3010 [Bryobacterales bacterium]|nr:hypothetical protein [Bryobacterales bacterium]